VDRKSQRPSSHPTTLTGSQLEFRLLANDNDPKNEALSPRHSPPVGDNDPIPLAEACRLFFRGEIGPATLRAENSRGTLTIERIGRKDFVTRRAIEEMREKCRVVQRESDSGYSQHASLQAANLSNAPSGASEMGAASEARAALRAKLQQQKKPLVPTSSRNTQPQEQVVVTLPKSK